MGLAQGFDMAEQTGHFEQQTEADRRQQPLSKSGRQLAERKGKSRQQQRAERQAGGDKTGAGVPVVPERARLDAIQTVHEITAKQHARQRQQGEGGLQQVGEFAIKKGKKSITGQPAKKGRYAGDFAAHRRMAQVVKAAIKAMWFAQMHIQFEQTEAHQCEHDQQPRRKRGAVLKIGQRG